MGEEKDELLYVTGWEVIGNKRKNNKININKTNTEGCEMRKLNEMNLEVKVIDSVFHGGNNGVTYGMMEYVEEGRVIAKGEGVLCTVESYLTRYLKYDLTDLDDFYEWKDYPRNTNYEVNDLGLIRNKNTGEILHMALKEEYIEGNKNVWRLRVSIPGQPTLKVSQVVAETFLGDIPVEDGVTYVIGHKNDIPIDNRVDNLEYITSAQNKTIDWVLREVVRKGLNIQHVRVVYDEILDVLEDKCGTDVEVEELTDEDVIEVMETVDIYKRSVNEIYKYMKYGTGVLSRLTKFGSNFYV